MSIRQEIKKRKKKGEVDIYLKNLKTDDWMRFPMLPTEVNVKSANQFANYNILKIGEAQIPSGTSLDSFSWSGKLPGERRKNDPYIRKWKEPKEIYNWINSLKVKNGKPVKVRLLMTGTPINCDVYLSSFNATPTGGYGDIDYDITLIQAKEIKVKKKGKTKKGTNKKKKLKDSPSSAPERTSKPTAQKYTVKKGDSLWKIAQKLYGSGSQYTKIYEANKGTVGSNPNKIYPGQVLTVP